MRNKNTGIIVVDIVNHTLGVGESLKVELKATPLILLPIEPILHHHIHRNLTLAELTENTFHLFLGVVFLAALPESESPLRHYLCATSEETITLDYIVIVLSSNEVVVHLFIHLSPDRHPTLLLLCLWSSSSQSAVCHTTVWLPFDAQRSALAFFEVNLKLISVGVPCSAPTLGHNKTSSHIHLYIS